MYSRSLNNYNYIIEQVSSINDEAFQNHITTIGNNARSISAELVRQLQLKDEYETNLKKLKENLSNELANSKSSVDVSLSSGANMDLSVQMERMNKLNKNILAIQAEIAELEKGIESLNAIKKTLQDEFLKVNDDYNKEKYKLHVYKQQKQHEGNQKSNQRVVEDRISDKDLAQLAKPTLFAEFEINKTINATQSVAPRKKTNTRKRARVEEALVTRSQEIDPLFYTIEQAHQPAFLFSHVTPSANPLVDPRNQPVVNPATTSIITNQDEDEFRPFEYFETSIDLTGEDTENPVVSGQDVETVIFDYGINEEEVASDPFQLFSK